MRFRRVYSPDADEDVQILPNPDRNAHRQRVAIDDALDLRRVRACKPFSRIGSSNRLKGSERENCRGKANQRHI
jgi:hypothetical protein